jgi:DNA polymerase III subunit epsilon
MGIPRFAVLDVETTSGNPTEGRVMEVAVVALDQSTERIRWESLVDPKCSIPPFIRRLTGIDNSMLQHSPTFAMVVRTLETMTEGRIVVAHNVRFDMTALEHEFARTGLVFDRTTLCTERISRRLVPNLSHYNLGSLCRHFGIPFQARHRAPSDAGATAQLLNLLLDRFGTEQVLEDAMPWRQALSA